MYYLKRFIAEALKCEQRQTDIQHEQQRRLDYEPFYMKQRFRRLETSV